MYTLNCKGKLLVIDKPIVMGIINITPDSFYASSRVISVEAAVETAGRMISEGATIVDIGGQSTRPGSSRLTTTQETDRVIPVIESLIKTYPEIIISIDTYSSIVASKAIAAGASIVNDISSGDMDENMLPVIAALNVPFICMHMQGRPDTMQLYPQYNDVTTEVLDYLIQKVETCKRHGIKDIIIDPGFGFGKTIQHNFTLLKNLSVFKIVNCPVLAGLSRKSTVYKTLGITAKDALNGTTVLNTIALQNGAAILRVHDVKAACETIALLQEYSK